MSRRLPARDGRAFARKPWQGPDKKRGMFPVFFPVTGNLT
jgi:hypothetical protein